MLIAGKVLWLCVNSLKCLAECGAKVPQNVAKKEEGKCSTFFFLWCPLCTALPSLSLSPLLFINEA